MSDKEINISHRQLKAGELIKRALVEIFAKGKLLDKTLADVPITVSEVRVTPDLKYATIFVFPLGGNMGKEQFIQALKNVTPTLRTMVTKKIQLKYSPELVFKFDDSFDNVTKIETILKSI